MLHFVKYGKREHLEAFMAQGSIQLGTLFSYDEATYGSKIGDDLEGLSQTTISDRNINEVLEAGFPVPKFSGIPLFLHPGCEGNVVKVTNVSCNYVVLCLSRVLHAELCRDFSEDYDCAVYITRPFVFLHEVSRALESSELLPDARFRHVSDITYTDRNVGVKGLGSDILEVFIKDPRYRNQREVRAIWSSDQDEQILNRFYRFDAPKATPGCRLIPLEDMPTYTTDDPHEIKIAQLHRALEIA
jgi:hypothetical protein